MMEDKSSASLFRGWMQDVNEGFPLGAKTKSYLTTNPSNHEAETDWMDTYEYPGENFNPFADVLIPEINADEFLRELGYEDSVTDNVLTPQGLSAAPLQSEPLYSFPESQTQYSDIKPQIPKIQINLKRVKLPMKTTSLSLPEPPKQIPKNEYFDQLPDELEENFNDDNLTLKDAIEMGCADDILDQLIDIVNPSEGKVLEEISSYIASDSEESFSSGTGSPSYSSFGSPGYSSANSPSTSYKVIELDNCTIIPNGVLLSPGRSDDEISVSSSRRSVKAIPKRLTGRMKLTDTQKKEKKMEQNKRAATRYRQKKKQEETEASVLLDAEVERSNILKKKHKDLKQEIRLMKKIMRELFIAKGMVSANAFKH